jgi:hypothetical protein
MSVEVSVSWPGESWELVKKKTSPPDSEASRKPDSRGEVPEEIRSRQPPEEPAKVGLSSVLLPTPGGSYS